MALHPDSGRVATAAQGLFRAGRSTMPGRRWSDGLHQAVEAKEDVWVREEIQTIVSITFQNYSRMCANLAAMTGTADTEACEFPIRPETRTIARVSTSVSVLREPRCRGA